MNIILANFVGVSYKQMLFRNELINSMLSYFVGVS